MGEYADIKDRIKELRLARHMSQEEVAKRLGVTKVAVSQWERGVKQPKMEMREALCDLFNVNMDYLNGNWDKVSRLVTSEEMNMLDNYRGHVSETEDQQVPSYYLDAKARDAADFLHKHPEYQVLFDASRKVKAEDINFVKEMIDRMSGES